MVLLLGEGPIEEPLEVGRLLLELLDPLVQQRKGQLLFVAFVGIAVVDHDGSKVAPLGYKGRELILVAYALLSVEDVGLEHFQLVEKFSRVPLEAIDGCYYFGNVVFVLLLRADVPMPLVLF